METAKLVLEFLKVLSWPAVALTAIFVFRRELQHLLHRLQKLKLPGGTELDWQKKLAEVEATAQEIEKTLPPQQKLSQQEHLRELVEKSNQADLAPSPSNFDFSYYFELTGIDPNLALAGLRMELERMLQNLAKMRNVKFHPYQTSPGRFSGLLLKEGVLPKEQHGLLQKIVAIANDALHGRDVTKEEAMTAIDSAEPFRRFYLELLEQL